MPTLLTPDGTREGGIRCNYDGGYTSREEDWHYNVLADNKLQDRSDILFNTPGLPLIGVTVINGMLAKGGDAQRDPGNALLWRVSLTLTTDVGQDPDNTNRSGDPTLWIPIRKTMWETKTDIRPVDCSNKKMLNSAKQPLDEKMQINRRCTVWEFTQFESATLSDTELLLRNEAMNSTTWPLFDPKPAKTWLCRVLDSEVGFFAGYRCRRTTYRVIYDEFKWTDKRLDIGTKYINSFTGKQTPYLVLGMPGNYPLDAGSRKIAEDGSDIGSGEPATLEFDPYPVRNFRDWFKF